MTISSSLGDICARARTRSRNLLSLAVIASLATAASTPPSALPYVPTTILLPGSSGFNLPAQRDEDKVAYIFRPTSESSVDFLALDISSTLSASSLRLETLTSGLPFLKGATKTTTFTPSLLSSRTVAAYVGDCASQSNTSAVWTAALPDSAPRNAMIKWDSDGAPDATGAAFAHSCKGPMFLGGAMSFSAQLSPTVSSPSVYYYGGMCPFTNQSGTDWTKSATYSNHVLKLGLPADNAFNISPIVTTGRSPGAQAGFTLTSLTPSISNRGDVVTQQLDSVMLGGHSTLGYIDMGEAAIWSVPQETWKLIKVAQPNAGRTELAVKKNELPDQVESRSGHTTVLSADGRKLVVLGGWVGDIKRAALPQLAILEVGADFSEWKWTIPAEQPQGQAIFGHGAAVLPGNIMMVYGGYSIPPETQDLASSRLKPRQAGASGEIPMFLNISSMTWSNEYTNPERPVGSGDGQGSAQEVRRSNLGLSLGLGLGLALGLIALAVVAYFLWRKRQRNRRRDSAVRALAQDASMFLPQSDMLECDDARFSRGWNSAQAYEWYTGGGDPFQRAARTRLTSPSVGYESLRGASGPESFSELTQKAVTRKPVASRSLGGHVYMPPPLDLSPRNRGATEMNVIHEADEEVEAPIAEPPSSGAVVVQTRPISQESDPFLTPTTSNGFNVAWRQEDSPRPSTGPGYTPDVQQWVQEAEEIDAEVVARIPSLRSMPRTTTITTSVPLQDSRPSSRSPTQRSPPSRALDGGNEAPSANLMEQGAIQSLSRPGSIRSPPDHARGITGALVAPVGNSSEDKNQERSSGESSGDGAYKTANSSFSALQAEGPALLAGSSAAAAAASVNSNQRRSLIGGTSPSQDDDDYDFQQGSPSKMKRRASWFGLGTLGSLRRAVSSSGRRDSASDAAARDGGGKTSSSERGVCHDPGHGGAGIVSRRRRQGREAWEVDASGSGQYGDPSTPPRRLSYRPDEDEDDWDIERASERRSVQYAFTVPREPLRVVNVDVRRESFDTKPQEGDDGESLPEEQATTEVEVESGGNGRTGEYVGMGSREDDLFMGDAASSSRARASSGSTPVVREPQLMGFPPGMPAGDDNEQDEGRLRVPTPRTPTFPRDGGNDDRNAEDLESGGLSPRQQSDRRSFESRLSIDSSANHVIGLAQAVSLTRGSALPTPRPSPPTRVMEMVGRIEEEEQRGESRKSSPARNAQMRK
ncbi:hypothetical protein PpBr36_00978 [Pyricularia pennisetigena]|uniref:hypothetical protein n=1 Tax=Pyricularia pennisetigena TaxID=1578925 RepID=UPI00114EBB7E|nr:hypothetical protein PpBr36_00978 [Pyricularia pennisetigena]TLS28348.1 hypothetical protein PpBr36_00978 [Pyricularia pennisetigena]